MNKKFRDTLINLGETLAMLVLALLVGALMVKISGNDPLDQMADRMALTQCLNQFLGGQKSQDRKLFVRRYWYMVPVRELALEFGFSESKVKMKLLRMRNHLKEALEKEGIDL